MLTSFVFHRSADLSDTTIIIGYDPNHIIAKSMITAFSIKIKLS